MEDNLGDTVNKRVALYDWLIKYIIWNLIYEWAASNRDNRFECMKLAFAIQTINTRTIFWITSPTWSKTNAIVQSAFVFLAVATLWKVSLVNFTDLFFASLRCFRPFIIFAISAMAFRCTSDPCLQTYAIFLLAVALRTSTKDLLCFLYGVYDLYWSSDR